ncbi:hypothetical protein EDC01DRAFT_89601 [Geopyxis carbonaria]|nr:hypothetical protein EDC01DRAFT_89601 [Geopyxis carbonaria]
MSLQQRPWCSLLPLGESNAAPDVQTPIRSRRYSQYEIATRLTSDAPRTMIAIAVSAGPSCRCSDWLAALSDDVTAPLPSLPSLPSHSHSYRPTACSSSSMRAGTALCPRRPDRALPSPTVFHMRAAALCPVPLLHPPACLCKCTRRRCTPQKRVAVLAA